MIALRTAERVLPPGVVSLEENKFLFQFVHILGSGKKLFPTSGKESFTGFHFNK